jgi:hypothetical protein
MMNWKWSWPSFRLQHLSTAIDKLHEKPETGYPMSGERYEPVTSRTLTRKNAKRFDGDTGLEFLDSRVESRIEFSLSVCWYLIQPDSSRTFIAQTVSRDDRQCNVRRYSSLP